MMPHPIRPMVTFILRLWREPGAPTGDAGWRGLIRPLDKDAASNAVPFQGMGNLLAALRQSLIAEEASAVPQNSPTEEPGAPAEAGNQQS